MYTYRCVSRVAFAKDEITAGERPSVIRGKSRITRGRLQAVQRFGLPETEASEKHRVLRSYRSARRACIDSPGAKEMIAGFALNRPRTNKRPCRAGQSP